MDTYLSCGVFIAFVTFSILLVFRYVKHWSQLKRGFEQIGMKWPFPTAVELNEGLEKDYILAASKVWVSPFRVAKLIFFTRFQNPIIANPIKGIRRCFLAILLFPLVVFTVLIIGHSIFTR